MNCSSEAIFMQNSNSLSLLSLFAIISATRLNKTLAFSLSHFSKPIEFKVPFIKSISWVSLKKSCHRKWGRRVTGSAKFSLDKIGVSYLIEISRALKVFSRWWHWRNLILSLLLICGWWNKFFNFRCKIKNLSPKSLLKVLRALYKKFH